MKTYGFTNPYGQQWETFDDLEKATQKAEELSRLAERAISIWLLTRTITSKVTVDDY